MFKVFNLPRCCLAAVRPQRGRVTHLTAGEPLSWRSPTFGPAAGPVVAWLVSQGFLAFEESDCAIVPRDGGCSPPTADGHGASVRA